MVPTLSRAPDDAVLRHGLHEREAADFAHGLVRRQRIPIRKRRLDLDLEGGRAQAERETRQAHKVGQAECLLHHVVGLGEPESHAVSHLTFVFSATIPSPRHEKLTTTPPPASASRPQGSGTRASHTSSLAQCACPRQTGRTGDNVRAPAPWQQGASRQHRTAPGWRRPREWRCPAGPGGQVSISV